MSKKYYGSINLTAAKEAVEALSDAVAKANGKTYIKIDVWINDDKDQYGNVGSIKIAKSKVYLGNLKESEQKVEKPEADEFDLF